MEHPKNTKHGFSRSTDPAKQRTYNSWAMMRGRCRNPRNVKFYMYGGAGITIDPSWETFEQFLSDMGQRPAGTSLDRINGKLGYGPTNCRWATPAEQSSHLVTVKIVEYEGLPTTITELSKRFNVPKHTLRYRIEEGWPQAEWAAPRHGCKRRLRQVHGLLSGASANQAP